MMIPMMPSYLSTMSFAVERLGPIMEPEPGNPLECAGVLNPAGVTGPDGAYYLFPRLVAAGNYSRIGIARVRRDAAGRPVGVERLGLALEPETRDELVRPGVGGCEDPRVTYVAALDVYVMAYTALGPSGAKVALAMSRDLRQWERLGLVDFATEAGADFNRFVDKDALLLPRPVRGPDGRWALAMLHRPIYEAWAEEAGLTLRLAPPDGVRDARPSIWLSYCPLEEARRWVHGRGPARFAQHRLLATPVHPWEADRIGGGTVPLLTAWGWLMLYHGVHRSPDGARCYRAGMLLLDRDDPRIVRARSVSPTFGPETADKRVGVVGNVVFPEAVAARAGGIDVYYGMADSRIGAAHLRPMWRGVEHARRLAA